MDRCLAASEQPGRRVWVESGSWKLRSRRPEPVGHIGPPWNRWPPARRRGGKLTVATGCSLVALCPLRSSPWHTSRHPARMCRPRGPSPLRQPLRRCPRFVPESRSASPRFEGMVRDRLMSQFAVGGVELLMSGHSVVLGVSSLRAAGPLRCASSHRVRPRLAPHGLPSLTRHSQACAAG